MQKRTLTRLIAVQILYQSDFFGDEKGLKEIKNELLSNYILQEGEKEADFSKKIDEKLLDNLIFSVFEKKSEIDEEIKQFLTKSREIDSVLRQILRLGSLEMKISKDIDGAILIDEYTKITASFFADEKVGFCNSILQNFAKKYDK